MEIHVEKQSWKHSGKNFEVEICHWVLNNVELELSDYVQENRWNVYAYIYPKHPLFNEIVRESIFDYGINLPLHCFASCHYWIYDAKGTVVCKKIGSDYSHLHDDCFGKYKNKEEAWRVFKDADVLTAHLSNVVRNSQLTIL